MTHAPTAAAVTDVEGYASLVAQRLEQEGFAVARRGAVGEFALRLMATRKGGSLRHADTLQILFADHAEHSPRGTERVTADSLIPFALSAFEAQAPAESATTLLRGTTYVVPVLIARSGPAPTLAKALGVLQMKRDAGVALPAVVDVTESAVHLLRRADDLGRDGKHLVPYLWWLLSPRMLPRPARKLGWTPLRRIGVTVACAAVVMFTAAYLVMRNQPESMNFRVWATDSLAGHIAYIQYEFAGDPTSLVVLDADGAEVARTTRSSRTFLCELRGDAVTYLSCDYEPDECRLSRAGLDDDEPERVFSVRRAISCPAASPTGDRFAYSTELDTGGRVWLHDGERARRAQGSKRGDRLPSWFPDGRRVLVSAGRDGYRHLVALDVDTGERSSVTERGSRDTWPAVSPDGARAAFYRAKRRDFERDEAQHTSAAYDLMTIDVASGTTTRVMSSVCFGSRAGWLSPTEVAYGKWTGENCSLYVYDFEDDDVRSLQNER